MTYCDSLHNVTVSQPVLTACATSHCYVHYVLRTVHTYVSADKHSTHAACPSACPLTLQVRHPSAIGLAEGDYVDIRYFGRDPTTGRARVSRKSLLPLPDQASSPHHHSSLANEKEDVGQRPFPSRSMHLHQGRASEHHPALERPITRYTRHRRPTERVWSQREGGQPRVHQERSGYSPRWTSKY